MNNRKYILPSLLISTVLLTACSTASQKAEKHQAAKERAIGTFIMETSPVDRAAILTEEMTQLLQLDASQQQAAAEINLRYATRISAVMASTNPSTNKKAEIIGLLNHKENAIKSILNESQKQYYKAQRAALFDVYRTL